MNWFSKYKSVPEGISWQKIESTDDVDRLFKDSETSKQLIFKHSTRCPVSSMALKKLEREWDMQREIVPHFLDLLSYRQVSAYVETVTGIQHESPQAIVLFQRKVIYHNSHQFIDLRSL